MATSGSPDSAITVMEIVYQGTSWIMKIKVDVHCKLVKPSENQCNALGNFDVKKIFLELKIQENPIAITR